jgi:Tol biopolymer transport system component
MASPDQGDLKADLWRRAYRIFDDALTVPREQQTEFARSRVSGDPELLETVLELLQQASEEEADVFEEPQLPLGSRIGRYEITGKLGRGGMGHVYSAHDLELGRVVALKLLSGQTGSPGKTGSAERLIREAKAASALNHPNIVTVYEVVRHGSDVALAMELVEGRSMREVCGSAQPAEKVVHWARQIAQALAATHARGIVHRDIKPENVMLRPDGYVKVLDFGLARRTRMPGDGTARSTQFDGLGGTLSYMSPEQIQGKAPDQASDIFSLGAMLYELLCGRHPFQADSPIDTAYAIAHQEPKPAALVVPQIPAELSALVSAMMAKKPEDRPTSLELEQRLALPRRRRPFTHRRWVRVAAVVSLGLVLAAAGAVRLKEWAFTPKPLVLDPVTRLLDKNVTAAAVSPDGSELVYALFGGPLYLRRMSDGGTRSLHSPPDLRASRLAWFADGKQLLISGALGEDPKPLVWVLPLDGIDRDPVLLPQQGRNAAPSPDGARIVLCSNDCSAIRIIDRDGSNARVIRSAEAGANFHSLVWSPDSKRLSYMVLTQVSRPPAKYSFVFETVDAESGAVVARIENLPLFSATALPDGRIVGLPWAFPAVSHGGELIEIDTNPATGEITGRRSTPMPQSTNGVFSSLTVSSDGTTMALISASEFVNVYSAEVVTDPAPALRNVRRLTFGLTQDYPQSWTSDSTGIVFESNRNGKFELFRYDLAGSKEVPIFRGEEDAVQPKVTPDGRWILFRQGTSKYGNQLMRIPVGGSAQPTAVPMDGMKGAEQGCGLSPESRCVARSVEADQFVVRELDPLKGKGRVLARIPYGPYLIFDWSLSPDGTVIATPNHDLQSALIRLTPLDARMDERFLKLEGLRNLCAVSWSRDGKGMFVTATGASGGIMLYTDLEGHVSQLLESSKVTFVLPSPDGHRIAYPEHVTASTVQLLKRP